MKQKTSPTESAGTHEIVDGIFSEPGVIFLKVPVEIELVERERKKTKEQSNCWSPLCFADSAASGEVCNRKLLEKAVDSRSNMLLIVLKFMMAQDILYLGPSPFLSIVW